MKLEFLGAARMVTGSSYLLEHDGEKLLVDCGMKQGSDKKEKENYTEFSYDPSTIDTVVITHAHIDHTGLLPKLIQGGFKGRIIMTKASSELIELMLHDSAKVQDYRSQATGRPPLYTDEDVSNTVALFEGVDYHQIVESGEFTIQLFDAGHVLGSATVRIDTGSGDNKKSIAFSGDLGNHNIPLMRETEPLSDVDYVVMESTYGNRNHGDVTNRSRRLLEVINQAVSAKGVLLIPAFSLERTQEVLYELNELSNNGELPDVPVFLDGPLGIKATRVYPRYFHQMDEATQEHVAQGDDVFDFDQLRITETARDSKSINGVPEPKIIIAGSGMMHGGRIQHHLKRYVSSPTTHIAIIGYQGDNTMGRAIQSGASTVKIDEEEVAVNAVVHTITGYSAHADQSQLLDWVDGTTAKKIWLTHGDVESAETLAGLMQEKGLPASVPEYGQVEEL